MPVVGVNRDKLFEALGKKYSERAPSGGAGGHGGGRQRAPPLTAALRTPLQPTRSLTSCVSSMASSWTTW